MNCSTTDLPIQTIIPELQHTLSTHTNVVLQAPPGAGKTTVVPASLLDEVWMRDQTIIMLEPRRMAARAAAGRMARMRGERIGETVGFRVRMDSRVGKHTRIEVITEGILTRYIQNDPSLEGVGLVIFDEFHERSIHADLGLALCLEIQEVLREDLRILVMSATLDSGPIAALLGNAPVITGAGRSFDVETYYLGHPPRKDMEQEVSAAVIRAVSSESGSILVFMPGEKEIRRTQKILENANPGPDIHVMPLFGNLSQDAQDQAILPCPAGKRKIVLATSIAETSLTIEGIRVVIDSGLMRVPRFDIRSGMTRLSTVTVSKSSADQRRGRAGRMEPGICYRLWTKAANNLLAGYNTPEILETDLSPLALELARWGVSGPEQLKWLDTPPAVAFSQAVHLLSDLGAVDNECRITPHGKQIIGLGLHPRLAHMVLMGQGLGYERLACDLAAFLSERDIIRFKPGYGDADIRIRIGILDSVRQSKSLDYCEGTIDFPLCRRIIRVSDQLYRQLKDGRKKRRAGREKEMSSKIVGTLLSFAYPDRIARSRPEKDGRFLLSNGRGAYLPGIQTISGEDYIVAAHLDSGDRQARIFLASPFNCEVLEQFFTNYIKNETTVNWDNRKKRVLARKQKRFGKIVIEDNPLPDPDESLVIEALLSGIRQQGLSVLPWTKESRMIQARVRFLRRIEGKDSDWPDVSDGFLEAHMENWLAPYITGVTGFKELQRIDLGNIILSLLAWEQRQSLDDRAPVFFKVPGGSRIRLDYINNDTPVLPVRIQEIFGLKQTPTIAGGKVSLILHLLSPAFRPVQITQDLAGFWKNTYADVKKDLKGRYPKHHWPDDPLTDTTKKR